MIEIFVLIEDYGDTSGHGFHGVFNTLDKAKEYVPKLIREQSSGWWIEEPTGYSMANTEDGGRYIIYNDKMEE